MSGLIKPIPEVQDGTVWEFTDFSAFIRYVNQKVDGPRCLAFKRTNVGPTFGLPHNFLTNLGWPIGSYSLRITIKDSNNDLVGNYTYQETTGDQLTITLTNSEYRLTGEIVVEAIPFS